MNTRSPQRIVCLTEESTELLYLLGEEDRIVGISGFTVRPKRARKEKPKVSLFTDASYYQILDLRPDLVIGFSDIQADIAAELIKRGVSVWISNHRSLEEIKNFIWQLGVWVERQKEVEALIRGYEERIHEIEKISKAYPKRPKVYFEEWFDPLISGIRWVSELIEIAGGEECFKELSKQSLAKDRIIADPNDVVKKDPELIMASWCGKMFKKKKLLARENWDMIKAVKEDEIYEIDSAIILQPGPAALSAGLEKVHSLIDNWVKKQEHV